MTIDLTAAELREFAKVWESDDDAVLNAASERIEEFIREIDKDVLAILSSLALALADAMEELSAARKVIRLVTWESIAGANRRNGKEPPEQWRNFPDYGYYLADPDNDTYVECPIPDEHIPTVRAAHAEEHTDGND